MARKEAASKLTLKVITGVGADGKNLYKNRTIAGLAPVLTDADALAVGLEPPRATRVFTRVFART